MKYFLFFFWRINDKKKLTTGVPTIVGATTAGGGITTGCPGIGWIIAGGRVNVCGIAIPGGGITGATVAIVGGAIIVAAAILGLTIPGKAICI